MRAYPKPPAFFPRFVLLLLKPESWPAAAQYPFWVTLLPLIFAVVIASAAVAYSARAKFFEFAQGFASTYDKHYPALQVNSEGEVHAGATTQPFDLHLNETPFIVDPAGKTSFESVKGDYATLISNGKVYQRVMGMDLSPQPITSVLPYCLLVPPKGETRVIDGAHISAGLAEYRTGLEILVMVTTFAIKALAETIWIVVMLFLLRPAIMVGAMMGEKRLIMPKRALYRIAAALLVPVVMFAGITQAAGYSAASVVGAQNALILWYFACALMAVWAGHMAQQMYTPKTRRPRQS
jgi:hypothetical protein